MCEDCGAKRLCLDVVGPRELLVLLCVGLRRVESLAEFRVHDEVFQDRSDYIVVFAAVTVGVLLEVLAGVNGEAEGLALEHVTIDGLLQIHGLALQVRAQIVFDLDAELIVLLYDLL